MAKFGFSQGNKTVVKLIGCELTMQTSGDDIAGYLTALGLRIEQLEPVLERFGKYMIEQHIPGQFKAQGKPKRWARLNDKYAEWKRKHYGSLPKLVLSGRMRAGFSYQVKPRSLRVINRVTAGQGRNKTPRWVWHQNGTENMPARPMAQMTKRDWDVLRQYAMEYLTFETGGGVL